MPIVAHAADVAAQDQYDAARTFGFGPADRLDVTALNGDVLLQVQAPAGGWEPPEGLKLRQGLFRSVPGLALSYPPAGVVGVRFRRAVAGVAATVDFEAHSVA